MSIDELRADFARASGNVVPIDDPYGRLIDRRRRRLRHRIGALLGAAAAVVAATVLAPLALQSGFPGHKGFEGYRVESEWTWKMLRSPTRGNLGPLFAEELTGVFDRGRRKAGVGNSLPQVKVLFAHESPAITQVVVAYHSGTHASVVTRAAPPKAKAQDLLDSVGDNGIRPAPFLVTYTELDAVNGSVIGIAPQECEVRASVNATIGADGSWLRTYRQERAGDNVLNFNTEPAEVWQVTCDGKIREVRPARRIHEVTSGNYGLAGTGRGDVNRLTETAAAAVFTSLHFAVGVGGEAQSIWGGLVPGVSDEPASLLATKEAPGIVVLHFGTSSKAMVALEPDGSHQMPVAPQTAAAARQQWSISSTGFTASNELIAIRIPKREATRAVVSDKVLVVGPAHAAKVVALNGSGQIVATADLADGVGVLTLSFGAAISIRVTSQAGDPLETAGFHDDWAGPRIFGDRLVTSWQ